MARAARESLGPLVRGTVLVTKDGHSDGATEGMHIYEARHPVPDERGVEATRRVIEAIRGAPADTLVLALVSGGGSSLLVAPAEGIRLAEKQHLTDALLMRGAEIRELNTVRKHLSAVKGGRLAALAFPTPVLSLVLSDVVGNPLDAIASGPTSPDPTSYGDAADVLRKYDLYEAAPNAVRSHLEDGVAGTIPETPKPGDRIFDRVVNRIIGDNDTALDAMARRVAAEGVACEIVARGQTGEAKEIGRLLAERAMAARGGPRPRILLSGGETTVTVRGDGRGGRNTELALAFAMAIDGVEGISLLSAGTDGADGPTDAAGAFADGESMTDGRARGLDAADFLKRNDSYTFFDLAGGLLRTGPTGTNVMDLQIVEIA